MNGTLYLKFTASSGVTTDSRSIPENSIFFALKGDNFNGNKFALQALEAGASYAVIDEEQNSDDTRLILVDDVLTELQNLSNHHRNQFDIPVIGITGSNGKTTTKELMRDVLSKKYNFLATKGNFNNHIGVPLTLLGINEAHDIAIIEMGANHVGEIALLSEISNPTHGMITNIGKAHIGEFGGIENIIKAKTELFNHMREHDGRAFVNGNSEILMKKSEGIQRLIYGDSPESVIKCNLISSNPYLVFEWNGNTIKSQLIGDYNLSNMTSAIALGSHFGVSAEDICSAIEEYVPDNNRSQLIERNGIRIIMDAYNANPDSMEAAISNLKGIKADKKLAILGDMLELGPESLESHKYIMRLMREADIETIYVGPEFLKAQASEADCVLESTRAAITVIEKMDLSEYLILIKGSRGIKLEGVLEAI